MNTMAGSLEHSRSLRMSLAQMTPRTAYYILAGFLVILLLGFTVLDYVAPSGRHLSTIAGVDKVNYFDTTHSLLFDRDFNLNNEYTHIKPDTLEWTAIRPETGLPGSPWGIGYSVLEIPFLGFGTVVDGIVGNPADGYARFARFFYAIGNVFIGGFGLMALFTLLYRASCSWGVEEGKAVHYSLFTTFAVFFGTNIGYYTFSQISHASTFLFGCLFLAHWWNIRFTNTPRSWFVLGLLGGFLSICRWQDVVYVGGPFLFDLLGKEWIKNPISWLKARLVYCAGLLICWVPQMAQWKIIYGKYVTLPQGGGLFSFPPTHMLSVLFSSQNGWFVWTPLIFVGAVGVAFALGKHAREFLPWIVPAAIEWTVVGSMYWWHGMDSFSARYMLSATPLVALGLAALLAVSPKVARGVAVLAIPCCIFALLFAIQFRLDLIPKSQTLTAKEIFSDKLHLIQVRRQKVAANTAMRLVHEGNASTAIQMLESAEAMGEDRDVLGALAAAYKAGGRTAEAEDAEARLRKLLDKRL
jgi:hypothetical protein